MRTPWLYILAFVFLAGVTACQRGEGSASGEAEGHHEEHSEGHSEDHPAVITLPEHKVKGLGLDIGPVEKQKIYVTVAANGELAVPPQNSALVTAIVGANIQAIEVLEGEKVRKGQVLAYIAHPNLIAMQSDFLKKTRELNFWKAEYQRRKEMYRQKATSGKALQEAEMQYGSIRAEVSGLQKQLMQLHVNIDRLQAGEIVARVPVLSPIDGFVEKIFVRLGQFVAEQQPMFSVLNNDHLHADLMVYESDADKIRIGQKVFFHTQSRPEKNIAAHIIAMSRAFEEDPKAIHVHADIDDRRQVQHLMAGMFIEGRIVTDSIEAHALREAAVVVEDKTPIAFKAQKEGAKWRFEAYPLTNVALYDSFYVFSSPPGRELFVRNDAYYLISELKKGEMEHDH